jgi:anti-sigma regulatory factor (Ser/Thr protein kinase)
MPASSKPFPSFWTLHLVGWVALGLSMWVGVLPHAGDPVRALAGKMIFATWGGILTLGLRPLYRRLHDRSVSIPRLVAVTAVCSYLVSLVWTVLYRGSTDLLWKWMDGAALTIPPPAALMDGVLFYTFIPMAWSVLYFGIKYYEDAQAERERALAAEGLAHQAQLQALRYQLNPHFLFNTLNAISTLIVERRNRDAERMVARLSDFLRVTLDGTSDVEIPLADELDYARRYLDIEQVRLGDRLAVREDVDPETLSARVPPLLLQPLIENAVRHGVAQREDGGTLTLETRCTDDHLLLRVANHGPERTGDAPPARGDDDLNPVPTGDDRAEKNRAEEDRASGVGLANTKARLEALYGDEHAFSVRRTDGGGWTVDVTLPLRTTAGEALSVDTPDATVPEAPLSDRTIPA